MSADRIVALVGAGHAHIEVIRRFREAPVPGVLLCVADPKPRSIYSGMVPGFVAGRYRREELEIDIEALCLHPQIRFVPAAAERVDAETRAIRLTTGETISYHLASLDIGSTVAGAELPGVREYALASRPMDKLLDAVGDRIGTASRIVLVGAGAGGVELAFCLDARLNPAGSSNAEITLLTSDDAVLAAAPARLRRRVERALGARGIRVRARAAASAVGAEGIELRNDETLPCDTPFWVTGPAAHPLATTSALATDARGFIRIRPTLQSVGESSLFAVGDCASLPGMKKAGVYAVRAGPLLDANLRAALQSAPLRAYVPQADFLSLLNLGDGSAIAAKWGWASQGRAWMRLKDRIDRAFVAKYRA